jgi:hypothetical protein
MTGRRWFAATIAAALLAAASLGLVPQPGADALAQTGGTPAIVNAYACIVGNGGAATVPAGSEVVIRQGYASTAVGGLYSFLKAQTTILSVNDRQMVDVSASWADPEPLAGFAGVTRVTYPTGTTLAAGDSMRFTFAEVFDRPLTDPSDYDGDGRIDPAVPPADGLAFGGTCTVTAA